MASTTLSDTRPSFSRLTEGKARQSWRAALPAVVVIVAFVALVAYLAARLSSYSQRASAAERDAGQYRDQLTAMSKQIGTLQSDVSLARSPGRTTVVLQAPESPGKKKAAASAPTAWAAVTWGEQPDGKSWMRVNAYGLSPTLEGGKVYHVWMQPQTGDPVEVGTLDVDRNGSGFAMKESLPGIDQGKAVMLTTDADNSKKPGDVVARADLPKLEPSMSGASPGQAKPEQAQSTNGAAQPGQNQARPGAESQQMHQGGK